MSLGRVFELSKKICPKHGHGPFIVDGSLDTVECKTCNERLNPMYVLKKLAQEESNDHYLLKKLSEAKAQAMDKTKTKCEHCLKITRIKMRQV